MTEWRKLLPRYDRYEVTADGRVRSQVSETRELKPYKPKDGGDHRFTLSGRTIAGRRVQQSVSGKRAAESVWSENPHSLRSTMTFRNGRAEYIADYD